MNIPFLRPCEHCGGVPERDREVVLGDIPVEIISCESCGSSVRSSISIAADVWNKRTSDSIIRDCRNVVNMTILVLQDHLVDASSESKLLQRIDSYLSGGRV
jgi:hypothetical protein